MYHPEVPFDAWSDDDKTNFRNSLTSLKTEIDNYLAAQPVAPAALTTKKASKKLA